MTYPFSTYASDPEATHVVLKGPAEIVHGWYTSEFDAHRAAKLLRNDGYPHTVVKPYTPVEMSLTITDLFS
jgi:hypothetical protein